MRETGETNNTVKRKKILYWNSSFLNVSKIAVEYLNTYKDFPCEITDRRQYLPEADAVVFSTQYLDSLPKKIRGQVWVFETAEAPLTGFNPTDMKQWDNLFNYTMTYRRDSDFPMFYDEFTDISKNEQTGTLSVFANKSKFMIWFVGHCKTESKREVYAREIEKHCGKFKIIGKCGENNCLYDNKQCVAKYLNDDYKFYYSAENALCRDYITEKSFDRLRYNIVTFVRGGSNYSMYLPPGSYIDTKTYNNSAELCQFLKIVGQNRTMYDRYFVWRKHYKIAGMPYGRERPWRDLCMRLHNPDKHHRLYNSIHDWWRGGENTSGPFCVKPN